LPANEPIITGEFSYIRARQRDGKSETEVG